MQNEFNIDTISLLDAFILYGIVYVFGALSIVVFFYEMLNILLGPIS